jgi:hypothetical protein
MPGESRGEVWFKEPTVDHAGRRAVRYADEEKLPFLAVGGGKPLLVSMPATRT